MGAERSERRRARTPTQARVELLVGRLHSKTVKGDQAAADLMFLLDQIALIEHERDEEGLAAVRRRYGWSL